MTKHVYANTLAVIKMIEQLQDGATVAEMVDDTGLHVATVRRWMRHLHSAKLVHISGHERSAGPWPYRVWRWGQGRDVALKKETSTQRWHRHVARKRDRMMQEALHA